MELYNNTRCVTYEELVNGGLMSVPNYKWYKKQDRFTILQKGCKAHPVLIEYDSLPSRIKEAYDNKYPDASLKLKKRMMMDDFKMDETARNFYKAYPLDNGSHLSEEAISEYTLNATVLNMMQVKYNKSAAMHRMCGVSKKGLSWKVATDECNTLRELYGHTLPSNPTRLKDKFNEYIQSGYETLISKKYCNKNTLKITEEAGKFLIAMKRCRVPVRTDLQIFEAYNEKAEEMGFKKLANVKSVTTFLSRTDIKPKWYDAVYGEQAARQLFQRKNMTVLPELPNALWYSDGTKLNLYYKNIDKRTGKLTVKTIMVYEIIDAASEVFIGYHISEHEDFVAQYNAFRMALKVSGCKPYEIVNDNQGGHKKLESFFNRICTVGRRTAPYNGSSKTIENIFGRFQQQILHQYWYWTGMNVTTKSIKSDPNVEFNAANKENLPTLDELKEIYAACRQEWNNMKHPKCNKSRIEVYKSKKNPMSTPVTDIDMIDLFWITTKDTVTFTSAGITIQVQGTKYTYEPMDENGYPDMNFRSKYTGAKFRVQYDPACMEWVRLLKETPKGLAYVADAKPYIKMHRAIQDQEQNEMILYREQDHRNKEARVERQTEGIRIESEYMMRPEDFGLNTAPLKGLNNGKRKRKSKKEERLELGEFEKDLSNQVADINYYDKY